jgi:hypothetical protein
VYDVGANTGWVNMGTDADTAMFAVESIRRWWTTIGSLAYPSADRLLITADGGGSTGSRLRLWKTQLAQLATQTGLAITVCHLPRGTWKWNKIEHRMFSAITMNWRGRPLETHEVVVETHRGDHHQDRAEDPGRSRHQHLPARHQDHRQGDEGLRRRPPATTRVPRRLELHRVRRHGRRHDTPATAGLILLWALSRVLRASLARIFREAGVARREPKKQPRSAWRGFVYPAPNACWQLDATEYVLTGGRKCVIFQLIDDHSRYARAAHVASGETAKDVLYKVDVGHAFQHVLVVSDGTQAGDKIVIAELEGEILAEHARPAPGIRHVGNGQRPGTRPKKPGSVTEDLTHQPSPNVLTQNCHPCPETSQPAPAPVHSGI